MKPDDIVICRCEEVTLDEIRAWIDRGYSHFDELKRILRVGMGPCQGRGCRDIILMELSRATGEPLDAISPGTVRPPVKPVKLGLLAGDGRDASE
jgi:bacterioferritin-associated ferredoxin